MVEPLRHRQTKGAANRYARPTAAAPHSDSTDFVEKLVVLAARFGVEHGCQKAQVSLFAQVAKIGAG
jgi:hypothetical protein